MTDNNTDTGAFTGHLGATAAPETGEIQWMWWEVLWLYPSRPENGASEHTDLLRAAGSLDVPPQIIWMYADMRRPDGLCNFCLANGITGECPGMLDHVRSQHRFEQNRRGRHTVYAGVFPLPADIPLYAAKDEITRLIIEEDQAEPTDDELNAIPEL